MKYEPEKLLGLLKEVAEKARVFKLDHPSCIEIAETINNDLAEKKKKVQMGDKYIYKLHKSIEEAIEHKTDIRPRPHPSWINLLAEFAGYNSYDDYASSSSETALMLSGYIGNWYSYVRCNSGSKEVLVSPVRIYKESKHVWMELKGPVRVFRGELRLKKDCLFCLLEADESKELHLVFKAGLARKPNVLQGVFSGVSTGGDPIAGREVLVRQDDTNYTELRNSKLKIPGILTSESIELRAVGEYFKEISNNNIKAGRTSTFDLTDLVTK